MSIRSSLKRRLLNDMVIKTCKKHGNSGTMLLILDEHTSKIISSCIRATELIDNGILALENINRRREPVPGYPAIYFLDSNSESVEALINDFKDRPMYKSAHVFFTRAISNEFMSRIENNDVIDRIGTLQEMNVDFTTVEDRVFTLSDPYSIPLYYWGPKELLESKFRSDCSKLLSLCLTVSDMPAVRYDGNSKVAKAFANLFHRELNAVKTNSGWAPKTKGSLLILDRGFDLTTPLVHEFTYQAMVYDLCGTKGELVRINNEKIPSDASAADLEKSTMVVNENEDTLWMQHRHSHIGLVGSAIPSELKKFKKDNKMAKWEEEKKNDPSKEISAKDMTAALRDFNKYSKLVTRFAKHTELSRECLQKIESKKLKDIAGLEQELTTGYIDADDAIDLKACKSLLKKLCQSKYLGTEERLRLLLIYLLTQGDLQDAIKRELMAEVNDKCRSVFRNIEMLGAMISNGSYKPPKYSKIRRKEGDARCEEITLLRYIPLVWELGNLMVLNQLDDKKYPYLGDGQYSGSENSSAPARGGRRGAGRKERDPAEVANQPYLIIYIVGGVTWSEAKAIYDIAEEHKVNIIIGGNDVLTPRMFLTNIADMRVEDWMIAAGDCLGEPAPKGKFSGRTLIDYAEGRLSPEEEGDKKKKKKEEEKKQKEEEDKKKKGKKYEPDSDDSDEESDLENPDF